MVELENDCGNDRVRVLVYRGLTHLDSTCVSGLGGTVWLSLKW